MASENAIYLSAPSEAIREQVQRATDLEVLRRIASGVGLRIFR